MAADCARYVVCNSIRQQLAGRAASISTEALERIGVQRRATIVIRIEGDKITYGIGGPKLAWDDVLVLGDINVAAAPAAMGT